MIFDAFGQKYLQQLPAICPFFERKTVARQLLRDGARALAHMARDQILQRGSHNAEQIVTVVLIEFCVLHRDHSVNEVGRQLFVRYCLAVLDIDLAEDLPVAIQNYTGRFHLLELVQVERVSLCFEIEEDAGNENRRKERQHRQNSDRNIKPRSEIPWRSKPVSRRRSEVCGSWFQWSTGRGRNLWGKPPTLNGKLAR